MKVRFLAEAERDFDEAVAYYDRQAPNLGREFALEVGNGLKRIRDRPEAWQAFGPRTKRFLLNRFPYGLVFAVFPDEIIVAAVMHLRRTPGYGASRLKGSGD